MKRTTSLVWRFFDRIENEKNRCLAVLCKLCDTQYKFFGNTTNLRSHLIHKHRLQWELAQSGGLEDGNFQVIEEESNQSIAPTKRRKYSKSYKDKNVRYSISVDNARNTSEGRMPRIEIQRVDVLDTSEVENDHIENEDNDATFNLVRQLHHARNSDEEWLEEDQYVAQIEAYNQKPKRGAYCKIKREVQSPPLLQNRRISSYTPQKVKFEKPAPVVIAQTNLRDEYSVFGEYVANKLRKFKAPRTRGNLQQLITTILWQAEYGTYDNAAAVKKVLMSTVHDSEEQEQVTHSQSQDVHIEIEHNLEEEAQSRNQSGESESIELI